MKGDVRFFKDEFKKQNPRKIMKIWAEKEEVNLRRYVGSLCVVIAAWLSASLRSLCQNEQVCREVKCKVL